MFYVGSFCCSFVRVIVVIVYIDFFAGAVSRTKVAAMPLLCRQQLQRLVKQKQQQQQLLLLYHRPAPTKPLVAKQGVVVCSRELRLLSSVACTCDLYCGNC